jgi:hypothetical protein
MIKLLTVCCAATLASAAFGQTFVSGTGIDTNPCTRTSPCATFQRAVNVTPYGGTVSVIDTGNYGAVVIQQEITIDGEGLGSILISTTASAVVIDVPATQSVRIRNLNLVTNSPSASVGINFVSGNQVVLDNVKVNGFPYGINVGLSGGGYADLFIRNSTISDSTYGISIMSSGPSITAEISNTSIFGASIGLSASAGRISLRDSTISALNIASGSVGLAIAGADVMVDNCQITRYTVGIQSSSLVQLSRSTLSYNVTAVQTQTGGVVTTLGNNSFFVNSAIGGPFTVGGLQ